MRLLDALHGLGRWVQYSPALARALGGPSEAIFLSNLLFRTREPGDWVAATEGEIEAETALSARQQRRCRKVLKALGVLLESREGLPARIHYSVDGTALDRIWEGKGTPDPLNLGGLGTPGAPNRGKPEKASSGPTAGTSPDVSSQLAVTKGKDFPTIDKNIIRKEPTKKRPKTAEQAPQGSLHLVSPEPKPADPTFREILESEIDGPDHPLAGRVAGVCWQTYAALWALGSTGITLASDRAIFFKNVRSLLKAGHPPSEVALAIVGHRRSTFWAERREHSATNITGKNMIKFISTARENRGQPYPPLGADGAKESAESEILAAMRRGYKFNG